MLYNYSHPPGGVLWSDSAVGSGVGGRRGADGGGQCGYLFTFCMMRGGGVDYR